MTELVIFPFTKNVIFTKISSPFKIITIFVFLKMFLQKITWPAEDSDDEDFDLESTCRITGFLRMFIETGINTLFGLCIALFSNASMSHGYIFFFF